MSEMEIQQSAATGSPSSKGIKLSFPFSDALLLIFSASKYRRSLQRHRSRRGRQPGWDFLSPYIPLYMWRSRRHRACKRTCLSPLQYRVEPGPEIYVSPRQAWLLSTPDRLEGGDNHR